VVRDDVLVLMSRAPQVEAEAVLHPQVLVDLLDGELALARQALGTRADDLHLRATPWS